MAEQQIITRPGAVPHHGPISADCPVECLRAILPLKSFNPLARAYDAPFDPPGTVGDVIELCRGGRLREIRGIGRRHTSEIEAVLVFAGLDITAHPRGTTARGQP